MLEFTEELHNSRKATVNICISTPIISLALFVRCIQNINTAKTSNIAVCLSRTENKFKRFGMFLNKQQEI